MIEVNVPGYKKFIFHDVVFDFNGTLAVKGAISASVAGLLKTLSERLEVHVVTADTFGSVRRVLSELPVHINVLPPENQAEAKRAFVEALGGDTVTAVGNGANDVLMLGAAAIGICVIGREGAAGKTLAAADVVVTSPEDAIGLLLDTGRLKATLRR